MSIALLERNGTRASTNDARSTKEVCMFDASPTAMLAAMRSLLKILAVLNADKILLIEGPPSLPPAIPPEAWSSVFNPAPSLTKHNPMSKSEKQIMLLVRNEVTGILTRGYAGKPTPMPITFVERYGARASTKNTRGTFVSRMLVHGPRIDLISSKYSPHLTQKKSWRSKGHPKRTHHGSWPLESAWEPRTTAEGICRYATPYTK